jgi:hypothetical protein
MPYTIRRKKCRQKSGKKGEKRRICHTSKRKAKAQISAIEMRETFSRDLLEYIAEVVKNLDLSDLHA